VAAAKKVLLPAYVVVAVISAAAATALQYHPGIFRLANPAITITFAVLMLAGELFPLRWLRLDEGGEITASWAFALAILLLERPIVAVVAIAGTSLAADLLHRRRLSRIAFNASQLALSVSAAGWLLEISHQRGVLVDPQRTLGPKWLLMVVLAGVCLLVVNRLMLCVAQVLDGEISLIGMLKQGLAAESRTDFALLALAPSLVASAMRSIVLLPLALLTAFVIHRVARRALGHEHHATHDSLTDLYNRRAFVDRLDTMLSLTDGMRRDAAVLVLDLDGFKSVNDTLGHHIGDQILVEVAARLTALHRPGQISARLGGDEFATLLPHVDSYADAVAWARALHAALAEPYTSFGFPVQLTASIGVAMMSEDNDTPGTLLRAADIAMYSAKRNSLGVQLQTRQAAGLELSRLDLIAELSGAIERDELFVEYQPQAATDSGVVFGLEALVRWQHPTLGLIEPSEFMPLAEQTELMQPITRFVLRRALTDLAGWRARGWNLRVAINVSAQNLHNLDFPALVERVLEEVGVPGTALELEITENAVMTQREIIRSVLRQLRELGTRIVIDDFGTGYSSLANMRHLPLDGVKIDRSFVRDLDTDHDDLVIVSSIIELARNLHLETTAEGVEGLAAWERLADLGCTNVQGYMLAKPMPAQLVFGWLQRYQNERPVDRRPERPRLHLVNGA